MLQLIVLSGGLKNAVVSLTGQKIAVGRDDDNDFVLEDTWISRHHAVLVRNDDGYLLRDLGSRNGCFVNGQRIQEKPLQAGDRVRLGETEFRYESIPETASADATRLAEAETTIRDLTGRANDLAAQQTQLQTELAAARQELTEQQRQGSDRDAAYEKRLAQAEADRQRLSTELETSRETLAAAERTSVRLAELTQQHEKLIAELAAGGRQIAELQQSVAQREIEVAKLNASLANGAGQVAGSAQQVDLAQPNQQIEELTRKQNETLSELEETKQLLAQTRTTLAAREAELTKREVGFSISGQRSKQTSDLASRNEVLLEEITTLRLKLMEKNAELSRQDPTAVTRLTGELSEVRAELAKVQAALAEARQQAEKPIAAPASKPAAAISNDNAEQQRLRIQQLTDENEKLADELEKVRREAEHSHQRFAEQVNIEMKRLRRERAGTAEEGDTASDATNAGAAGPAQKKHPAVLWSALVAIGVILVSVVVWVVRH
jgi:chromosome segregation ATPase